MSRHGVPPQKRRPFLNNYSGMIGDLPKTIEISTCKYLSNRAYFMVNPVADAMSTRRKWVTFENFSSFRQIETCVGTFHK